MLGHWRDFERLRDFATSTWSTNGATATDFTSPYGEKRPGASFECGIAAGKRAWMAIRQTGALVVLKQRSTHTDPGLCCRWERATCHWREDKSCSLYSTSKTVSRLQLDSYWMKGLDGDSTDRGLSSSLAVVYAYRSWPLPRMGTGA